MRLISHLRGSFAGLLFLLVASCGLASCGAASGDDQDGAIADAGGIDAGTPSPITDFYFVNGTHCDIPLSCDHNYSGSRDGALTHKYGYEDLQTATLNDADRARLVQYFDDPVSVTSLTNSDRCPYGVADASYRVTLVLKNGANVIRDINGCKGPQYDVINGWVATIAGYFP